MKWLSGCLYPIKLSWWERKGSVGVLLASQRYEHCNSSGEGNEEEEEEKKKEFWSLAIVCHESFVVVFLLLFLPPLLFFFSFSLLSQACLGVGRPDRNQFLAKAARELGWACHER